MHDDFLSKAAEYGNKAKVAIKEKDFDLAWRDFHLQKEYYLKHAKKCKFTLR